MNWWKQYPWRMVQTLLRETDMADIDAERYADDLKDFGATVVTLNAGGIMAFYPSRLEYHTVNPYLTGSSLSEIVDACHRRGIRVIARTDFSKIPYAIYEKHPEWAFRTSDGGIIEQNGFVQTCQNSEYQREKALEILREIFTAIPFDGLYCNMSGFFGMDYSGKMYGLCTCDACRQAYKAARGADIPTVFDMKKPEVMQYIGFQAGMGKKLRGKINETLKAISPEIAVDKIDYFRTESHTDIGEPVWVYSASSNSRLTAGARRERVSDNASADFIAFRYRESAVSPGVLELRQWQNLANAGNVSVFFLGRMDNHPDKSYYKGTKRVFDFHRLHEEELRGLTSEADVLLVEKNQASRSDPEAYGWIRALTESHVPFDEVRAAGLSPEVLAGKRLVILADAKDIAPGEATAVDAFAEAGGTVIVSGDSGVGGKPDSLACLGISQIIGKRRGLMSSVFAVEKDDAEVFRRCAGAPRIVPGAEITEAVYAEDVKGYLALLPEPMYGPPEVCYAKGKSTLAGTAVHRCGKGRGIYIPWNVGTVYYTEGYTNTLHFMQDILFGISEVPEIAPFLHPSVELVRTGKDGKHSLALINASGYFGNSFFDPIPMRGIEIAIAGVKSARCLNGGTVTVTADKIILDQLNHFEMIIWED